MSIGLPKDKKVFLFSGANFNDLMGIKERDAVGSFREMFITQRAKESSRYINTHEILLCRPRVNTSIQVPIFQSCYIRRFSEYVSTIAETL